MLCLSHTLQHELRYNTRVTSVVRNMVRFDHTAAIQGVIIRLTALGLASKFGKLLTLPRQKWHLVFDGLNKTLMK